MIPKWKSILSVLASMPFVLLIKFYQFFSPLKQFILVHMLAVDSIQHVRSIHECFNSFPPWHALLKSISESVNAIRCVKDIGPVLPESKMSLSKKLIDEIRI